MECSVSPEVYSEETDKIADNGCVNDRILKSGSSGHRPEDFVSTDQITAQRNTTGLELTVTEFTDCKPVNTIAEKKKSQTVINSPVKEESSLWDFNFSLDKPSDNNIEKDGCDEKGENVTVADDEITDEKRQQNAATSPPSIWDIPSSENNISPEPGGSRFPVSRNNIMIWKIQVPNEVALVLLLLRFDFLCDMQGFLESSGPIPRTLCSVISSILVVLTLIQLRLIYR